MKLVYSPWGTGDTVGPFGQLFSKHGNALKEGFDGADCFILWGGTDIHPSYYNEKAHPYNQMFGSNPSQRDVWEWKAMEECKERNIPIIGICRGAQYLCAFNGGQVVQHVNGHNGGDHIVDTVEGERFMVTSCHHQMLNVANIEHEMLAWSSYKRSSTYEDENQKQIAMEKEPEIVYFPQNNSLAIQGHPEWAPDTGAFVQYCLQKVKELLIKKEVEVCI